MSEISNLKPAAIWRNFDALTQIPRPSGHLEKVQQFLLDFAQRVGVEAFEDAGELGESLLAVVLHLLHRFVHKALGLFCRFSCGSSRNKWNSFFRR